MTDLAEIVLIRAALLLAIVVTPYALARQLVPRVSASRTLAVASAAAIALNLLVPTALQCFGIPIAARTLALAHWSLGIALIAVAWLRRLPILPVQGSREMLRPLGLTAGFALVVLPFTHLAGIDTYKWQDLATSVQAQQNIPWLIHPLSLLGFTPRSYPSAQPLCLATIQILGGAGVDWGYYLVSLLSGAVGIISAYALGERVLGSPRRAAWFAFLYAFSPVFMRYNHWATGRGFFVSLLPLFLLCLLELPRVQAVLGATAVGLLLALSHKTGLVAVILVPCSMLLALLLPRRGYPLMMGVLAVLSVLAALALASASAVVSPLGNLRGFLFTSLSRFGWYVPAAALAIVAHRKRLAEAPWRRLLPALLVTFPLAYPRDMYGALIALPLVTLAATAGWIRLGERYPRRPAATAAAIVVITLGFAGAIIVQRSRTATPKPVWEAACFLENYDPRGPYRVEAPGRAQTQIQAYVSGCPLVEVSASERTAVRIQRPPPIQGNPVQAVKRWMDWARHVFLVDADIAWYGWNPRTYYVVINGQGRVPPEARRLYARDGVEIYEPAGQSRSAPPP